MELDGARYTVDTQNKTVASGGETYRYEIDGATTTITYPDGESYWWTRTEMGGYGGWSDGYDADRYVSGGVLLAALEAGQPEEHSGTNFVLIVVVIAVGLFNVLAPGKAWYLSYGWMYRNAEPSDSALAMIRIGGAALLAAAVFLIFI